MNNNIAENQNKKQNLKIATWNVRTLLGDTDGGAGPRRKTALLAMELARYSVDFAALSETRLSGEGSISEGDQFNGYTIFWRGYPEGHPRQHGVGLAVRNCHLKKMEEEPSYVSERLMTLRIPLENNEYMTLICVYAPTLTAEEEMKDRFYEELDVAIRSVNPRDKIILLGDFNARVGRRSDLWSAIGPQGVGNMNTNGLRLLSLCSEHDLVITNTLFRLKNIHKTSWMHPRSKQWHLLDYIIVKSDQVKEVHQTRAMRGADCWTDHRLIMAKMRMKIRPAASRRTRDRPKKINLMALKDDARRQHYAEKVSSILQENGTNQEVVSVEEDWNRLTQQLLAMASETLGLERKNQRDWFQESGTEIGELVSEKNRAHRACLRNPSSVQHRQRFAELRSVAQTRLRELENDWWRRLAEEIQGYADTNNMQKFYESTKRIYGPTKRAIVPIRTADGQTLIKDKAGILIRWAEHFNELLNNRTTSDHNVLTDLPILPIIPDLDSPPTLEEVSEAVQGLKPRKAPGPDMLPSELLVGGELEMNKYLHSALLKIWQGEGIPGSWKDALITTIYKNKGDRAVCGNSRGISLLSAAGKVLARLLLKRLVNTVSESLMPETQCGFRANRSTVDMIFCARQLMEKCREQHRDLYIAFVDLSKAFDSVDRELLWSILRRCGCPPRFIELVRELHEGMKVRVRFGGELSESFEVSRGVKQGCVLAPVLFNIYVQCITRLLAASLNREDGIHLNYRTDRSLFDLKKLKAKTKISRTSLLELQYADDCALVAYSAEGLQQVLSRSAELYRKLGLQINIQKTEYMKYTVMPGDETHIPSIDGVNLKEVSSFKYLGSHIAANCTLDDEINHRIGQANGAYGRLRTKVFENRNLTLKTKVMVYHAVVVSSLLYGSETWTLYRRQVRLLEKFHMNSLRKILDVTWRDRVSNVEVLRRTGCVSVENILHRNKLRWVGHVIRMDEDRLPKQLLYGELSTGARSSGGQLKRYKDSTKKILKACNIPPENLEALAKDRQDWRTLSRQGLVHFEDERNRRLLEARERRHQAAVSTNDSSASTDLACPECGRVCGSRIGLASHVRAHQRRREAGRTVIVGHDGLP